MRNIGSQLKGRQDPFLCVRVSSSFVSGCSDPGCVDWVACWSGLKSNKSKKAARVGRSGGVLSTIGAQSFTMRLSIGV